MSVVIRVMLCGEVMEFMYVSQETWKAIHENPHAYEQGVHAWIAMKNPKENPYTEWTQEWIAWRAGWLGVS